MRLPLIVLALLCVGAEGRCGRDEEPAPSTPICVRTVADGRALVDSGPPQEGATCPEGWVVTCPADKPRRYCIYDQGSTTGWTRCIGEPLDWAFAPVRATCQRN